MASGWRPTPTPSNRNRPPRRVAAQLDERTGSAPAREQRGTQGSPARIPRSDDHAQPRPPLSIGRTAHMPSLGSADESQPQVGASGLAHRDLELLPRTTEHSRQQTLGGAPVTARIAFMYAPRISSARSSSQRPPANATNTRGATRVAPLVLSTGGSAPVEGARAGDGAKEAVDDGAFPLRTRGPPA
jgi:hypothetical protein